MNKNNEKWAWIYIGFLLTILLITTIIAPIMKNKIIKEYPKLVEDINKINCKEINCDKLFYKYNIKEIQENPYKKIANESFGQGVLCGLAGLGFLKVFFICLEQRKKGKENEKRKKKRK